LSGYSASGIGFLLNSTCRRFDPGGSLDRRVNYRCVSQPRWVGARWNTRGKNGGVPGPTSKLSLRVPAQMGRCEMEHKGENRGFVLSCAQGRCACSRGLQVFARERERACPSARPPARPPSRTRALDLPFIDVRTRHRCTMGV
jgi:hypothetical protein